MSTSHLLFKGLNRNCMSLFLNVPTSAFTESLVLQLLHCFPAKPEDSRKTPSGDQPSFQSADSVCSQDRIIKEYGFFHKIF